MRLKNWLLSLLLCVSISGFIYAGESESPAASYSGGPASGAGLGSAAAGSDATLGAVGPAGSFSYAYPIELPPGTAGMTPKLALSYNSAAPNGMLGVGFALSGLGAITRDPSYGIHFTSGDHYLYNGQKLFYAPAASGGDGRFHPERETFDRIEAYASTGVLTNNPYSATSYWVVTQKNGTKLYFGQTSDSRIDVVDGSGHPREWALNKVVDVNGNYYTVQYLEDGTGAYYPIRILYTRNDAAPLQNYRVVDFSYDETRPDHHVIYTPTQSEVIKRLRWISVRTGTDINGIGGSLVTKYRIEYAPATGALAQSRIDSIQQYGTDGTTPPTPIVTTSYAPSGSVLPKVTFDWSQESASQADGTFDIVTPVGNEYQGDLKYSYPNGGEAGALIIPGDFNGDGRTDFIRQEKGAWADDNAGTFRVYLSTGNGTFTVITQASMNTTNFMRFNTTATDDTGCNIIPGDFDGDGKTDFIRQEKGNYAADDTMTFRVYFSNGDGTFAGVTPTGTAYQSNLKYTYPGGGESGALIIPGDFDGDGKTDFIRQEKGAWANDTAGTFRVYLSTGDGTFGEVTQASMNNTNFMRFNTSATDDTGCNVIPGDFDGDGKTDFIRQEKGNYAADDAMTFRVYFSNGDGTFVDVEPAGNDYQHNLKYSHPAGTDAGALIIPGDYNGDGKTDFIRQEKGSWSDNNLGTFRVYLSTGGGYFNIVDPANLNATNFMRFNTRISDDSGCNIIPGDFNGDGKTDFLRQEKGTYADNATANFQVYKSVGDGTFLQLEPSGSAYQDSLKYTYSGDGDSGALIIPGDFDGDGKLDFIRQERDVWAADSANTFQVFFSKPGISGLITGIYDQYVPSPRISVSYGLATQLQNAVIPSSSAYPFVANARPLPLVTSVTYSGNIGPSVTTQYSYTNSLRLNGLPWDRKDLGFRTTVRTTAGSGVKSIATFNQTETDAQGQPVFYGLAKSVAVKDAAGKLISEIFTTYGSAQKIPAGSVDFIFPTVIVEKQYDGQTTPIVTKKTVAASDYDQYGNVTKISEWGLVDPVSLSDLTASDNVVRETMYAANTAAYVIKPYDAKISSYDSLGVWGVASETRYYYDNGGLGTIGNGMLTKNESVAGGGINATSTIEYDVYGNPVRFRDPRSYSGEYTAYTARISYDDNYATAVKTRTDALDRVIAYSYDAYLRPVSVVDANGFTTSTTYDLFGRVFDIVAPGDTAGTPTTKIRYGDTAFPRYVYTQSRESGSAYLGSYQHVDGLGRVIQEKTEGNGGQWITVDRSYDSAGRESKTSVPYFTASGSYSTADTTQKATTIDYSQTDTAVNTGAAAGLGRVVKTTYPDGTNTKVIQNREIVTSVDARGHAVVKTAVDGNQVQQSTYTGTFPSLTLYATTAAKTYRGKSQIVDNAGNTITQTLDMLGLAQTYADPDMGTWVYEYYADGLVKKQTDAKGTVIDFGYDALNRLKTKTDSASGYTYQYSYDETGHGEAPVGALTTVTYPSGSDSLSYDKNGHISSMTRTLDGKARTVAFSYDSLGRIVTETYPDGEVLTYSYGADGNLNGMTGTDAYVSAIAYSALGTVTSMTYGNGLVTNYDYFDTASEVDPSSGTAFSYRMKSLQVGIGANVMNLSYSYDVSGNVKTRTDGVDATHSETYTYDDLNRLLSASSTTYGSLSYAYDQIGNITSFEGKSYSYNTNGVRPHAVNGNSVYTYTYDTDGNMTGRSDGRTIAYDGYNRVASVSDGGSYVYNDGEQRLVKTENGVTTYYFFKMYEEEYTTGTLSKITKYYSANGQTVAQRSSIEGLFYVHGDHLASSSVLTDTAGTVVLRQGFKPYGEQAYQSGSAAIRYQFTGQEKESNGLYYYGARYYDPSLGKFISADTVLDGLNRYAYVSNNPINYVDPTGHIIVSLADGITYDTDNPGEYPYTTATTTPHTYTQPQTTNVNGTYVDSEKEITTLTVDPGSSGVIHTGGSGTSSGGDAGKPSDTSKPTGGSNGTGIISSYVFPGSNLLYPTDTGVDVVRTAGETAEKLTGVYQYNMGYSTWMNGQYGYSIGWYIDGWLNQILLHIGVNEFRLMGLAAKTGIEGAVAASKEIAFVSDKEAAEAAERIGEKLGIPPEAALAKMIEYAAHTQRNFPSWLRLQLLSEKIKIPYSIKTGETEILK